MNRTIISIEVQDESDRKTIIITRGERNSQMMFEETFSYKDEKKHSLRLNLLKERLFYGTPAKNSQFSLPSKINPNPDLPAAFIPFFRRIFFMAIAMKIHSPEKECGGKRISINGKITGINCDRRDA